MKNHWLPLALVVMAVFVAHPLPAHAADKPAAPSDTVTLNFVNADIEGVVKAMAEITGKNFVIDPRVKGTVNIISAQPVARDIVYDVFLAALRLQGFTAVEDHDLVRVLPEVDAKVHSNVVPAGEAGPDRLQTRVFTLKHQSAVQVAPALRPLVAPNNTIHALPGSDGMQAMGNEMLQSAGAVSGMIQADATTNSILIRAPDAIYNNLRAVVDKLDVRRREVYVEALIVELTASKAGEFGIQWQELGNIGKAGTQVFGGTNFGGAGQNIIGIAQNPASAGPGLNIGTVHGTVTIGGVEILNLGLLARALESDSNANILSTPTLLTLDNEVAKIVVGQNVPFITGQYAVSGAATTPSPFQTIERKDVGLTLKIRPQISEGGVVRLQIYQEVSSVLDANNPAGVITNTRSIESTVLVDDGQIVVLGGLIQDSVRDGVSKVPVLGSIPLLGGLFRYDNHSRTKTNLMVFLRPTILRDSDSAHALSSERYDYIRGQQIDAGPAHRDGPLPLLQPLPAPAPDTDSKE